MINIRIMKAKVSGFYTAVDVPVFDSTFFPPCVFETQYNTTENELEILRDSAQTDSAYQDYTRCIAVLKWARNCGGDIKNVSILDYGEGDFIRVMFRFKNVDSLELFNKGL